MTLRSCSRLSCSSLMALTRHDSLVTGTGRDQAVFARRLIVVNALRCLAYTSVEYWCSVHWIAIQYSITYNSILPRKHSPSTSIFFWSSRIHLFGRVSESSTDKSEEMLSGWNSQQLISWFIITKQQKKDTPLVDETSDWQSPWSILVSPFIISRPFWAR